MNNNDELKKERDRHWKTKEFLGGALLIAAIVISILCPPIAIFVFAALFVIAAYTP